MKLIKKVAIYDSGVGGLVVLECLKSYFYNAHYYYLADTYNFPYGDKSYDQLALIGMHIVSQLLQQADRVIIACHTMSAVLKKSNNVIALDPRVINVVDLCIDEICLRMPLRLGIIGTQATINTGIYPLLLAQRCSKMDVYMQPCPGLADLIEHQASEQVIKETLKHILMPLIARNIDALVLACTHYELIKQYIIEVTGNQLTIITLKESINRLANSWPLAHVAQPSCVISATSPDVQTFAARAQIFMQQVQVGLRGFS